MSTGGLVVDLFAGGGGASVGIEAAIGRGVDIAINHSAEALAVHQANHPETRHLTADIWEVRPREATGGLPVDILWASPDCTHFSAAKGGKPRKQNIRSLAWAVIRWAKDVRPRLIFLENVSEFRGWGPLGKDGQPDKARMGETFRRWLERLENLGYEVEYRVLDASLYGAPTRRRRLFLVARCDGQPIQWPEPTHGPGRLPLHTAAECIDWSLPCPSIFERARPLAEKTLWRIAQGIRRFVTESPRPFIVKFQENSVGQRLAEPLDTVMAGAQRFGVVAPAVVGVGGRAGQSPATAGDAPLGTVTGKADRALIVPSLVEMNADNAPHGADEPLGTVTTQHNRFNLVAANLMKFRGDSPGAALSEPVPTVTAGGHQLPERPATGNPLGLMGATIVKVNHGKREARAEDAEEPLSTVTATQRGHAFVSAFLAKHYGDTGQRPGLDAGSEPLATITASDHHAVAATTLVKLRGECAGADLEEPMPTVTAAGFHLGEVRAFLTAYYGEDGSSGQALMEPMRTLTAKHRLGLVTVEGAEYQIVDIGMRMLEPHELLRAQFGRFAEFYDMSAAPTKAGKVRLIGNSVCPEMAEALVRANVAVAEEEEVA